MGRPAPCYWWKIKDQSIVVYSDWSSHRQPLAVFRGAGERFLDKQVDLAEELIADFKAGRKHPPRR